MGWEGASKWTGRQLQPNVIQSNKGDLPELMITSDAYCLALAGCASKSWTVKSSDDYGKVGIGRGFVFS